MWNYIRPLGALKTDDALSLTTVRQCLRLRLTNPSTRDVFEVILTMCRLYFILSVNSTPKYGWCLTIAVIDFSSYSQI